MLAESPRASSLVVAHIRKANPPEIGRAWANTHPFERELGGNAWVFAHNGKLAGIHGSPTFATTRFLPVGDTDSESAFCFLLADGLHLVAHATGRLHMLERPCRTVECEEAAVLLATEPLSAEDWTPLERGSIHVFAAGRWMGSTPAGEART
jgi:glutamine amidotransferase